MRPTIGRVVHYVLPSGHHPGDHRPAIITRVWSETCVNLQVFTDGDNDYDHGPNVLRITSANYDADGTQPCSWHWPERE
jgi:hypothetical protein